MKAEVIVPDDYRPADDEPFMNDTQLAYFRRKLLGRVRLCGLASRARSVLPFCAREALATCQEV